MGLMPFVARNIVAVSATLAVALAAGAVMGASSAAQGADSTRLVRTDWLAKNLADRSVVVLVVDRNDSAYRAGHVPGARFVPYASISQTVNGKIAAKCGPATAVKRQSTAVQISKITRADLG